MRTVERKYIGPNEAEVRKVEALERLASAAEIIVDWLTRPAIAAQPISYSFTPEETAAILKSVGDDTP